jgi:CheY-like chemotaxis protein
MAARRHVSPVVIGALLEGVHVRPPNEQIVLLVDDDVDSRTIYGRVLAHAGYHVINAVSGADALAQASAVLPDIIVLDLGLPDMHGLEFVAALQVDQAMTGIRLVILTGYVSAEDRPRARAAGCHTYLLKPTRPRDLINAIEHTTSAMPGTRPLSVPVSAARSRSRPKSLAISQAAVANPTLVR